jgi:hypothetical protein
MRAIDAPNLRNWAGNCEATKRKKTTTTTTERSAGE